MHFGKRLAEFLASDARLVCLNYKQLKRHIKSGDFAGFLTLLESEVTKISISVTEFLEYLELKIALLQKELCELGVVYRESHLRAMIEYLDVQDHIKPEEAVDALVAEAALPERLVQEVKEVVSARNDLNEFLEINACGFRKIVKKFRKRASPDETPKYKHALDGERISKLFDTVAALTLLVPSDCRTDLFSPDSVGEELAMFIDC